MNSKVFTASFSFPSPSFSAMIASAIADERLIPA
jgi:hypothetical protein